MRPQDARSQPQRKRHLPGANNELISFFRALKRNIAFPACLFGKIEFLFGKMVEKPLFPSYFFGKIHSLFESASSGVRVRFDKCSREVRVRFETGSRRVRVGFESGSAGLRYPPKSSRNSPEEIPKQSPVWYEPGTCLSPPYRVKWTECQWFTGPIIFF